MAKTEGYGRAGSNYEISYSLKKLILHWHGLNKNEVVCMGYNRPGQKDLHKEIKEKLQTMQRFGVSKYADKKNGTSKEGIYSFNTFRTYSRECQKFAEYVKQQSPAGRNTSLEDARMYAKDYIQGLNQNSSVSAYTVKLRASALGKLYQCSTKDFGATESRYRAEITRSRNRTVVSDKTGKVILNPNTNAGHFSEKKNQEIVAFARGTGLRRSELESLKGTQLVSREGRYYLDVTGKGGRQRFAPVIGNVAAIVDRCKQAGSGRVWDKVPAHMDVHHYRSQYASELYKILSRERELIPREDRYYCRKELAGVCYDKAAMKEVSEALGHNRISVIAEHYLRD